MARENSRMDINRFSKTMGSMIRKNREADKGAERKWQDREQYVGSEGNILENLELEKLDLVYELYDREQKGFSMHKNDDSQVESKIYKRLGELMGVQPDLKFMGEMEHSSRLMSRQREQVRDGGEGAGGGVPEVAPGEVRDKAVGETCWRRAAEETPNGARRG